MCKELKSLSCCQQDLMATDDKTKWFRLDVFGSLQNYRKKMFFFRFLLTPHCLRQPNTDLSDSSQAFQSCEAAVRVAANICHTFISYIWHIGDQIEYLTVAVQILDRDVIHVNRNNFIKVWQVRKPIKVVNLLRIFSSSFDLSIVQNIMSTSKQTDVDAQSSDRVQKIHACQ